MSVTKGVTIDTAPLPAMLTQLRLPTIARLWPAITETADRESWPAAKTLAALFEHELAERAQRRTARHLLEARLPAGKTIDRFDFAAAPSVSKARIMALAEGDAWLTKGTNILIFGPPGVGKSHLGAALGHAMIDAGYRVLFTRTTDLVQHLQAARQDLKLATALEKLDKYHLLVLDDLSYVQKSQAETSVIFELISARYERRRHLIEQRLKYVMVAAVDQDDLRIGVPQRARRREPGKAAADDHDPRFLPGATRSRSRRLKLLIIRR